MALHLHSHKRGANHLQYNTTTIFSTIYRIGIKMRTLILLVALMIATVTMTQAQASKTLVKSLALTGTQEMVIDLPGLVENSEWDNDFVRITTYLTVENMNENIVKQLVLVGRYNMETELDETTGTIIVHMPKINNQVRVKGTALVETLRFEVQAPAGYQISVKEVAAVSVTSLTGGPAL